VRDYWNARPCNIRHSTAPIGTKKYFDEVAARKYIVESHIPRFAEFWRWNNKAVLEIGCGIGTDTIYFANGGALVTAVDLSSESLALAKQRAEVYGLQNRIQFYEGNAENLPAEVYLQGPYDLVYSFGVLHHTPHPFGALVEARSCMDSKSVLKVMLYHRWSWKVFEMMIREHQFWRLDDLIAENSEAQTGCPITYSYSRKSAEKMFTTAGLHIEKMEIEHIFPFKVENYVNYDYVWRPVFNYMPPSLFDKLQHTLGWHLCITARRI